MGGLGMTGLQPGLAAGAPGDVGKGVGGWGIERQVHLEVEGGQRAGRAVEQERQRTAGRAPERTHDITSFSYALYATSQLTAAQKGEYIIKEVIHLHT